MDKVTTIKIAKETRQLAKILAAYCNETVMQLLARLIKEEMERRGIKQ